MNKKASAPVLWRARLAIWLLRLAGRLSLRQAHRIGWGLGALLIVLPNSLKSTARRNIALCFNELNEPSRAALLRASLFEFGKCVGETPVLWATKAESLRALVKETVGMPELTQALEQGNGVVIAAPHLGAWELVGLYCSQLVPMTSLYKPARLDALNEPVRCARTRFGASLVPTDKRGVRALLDALDRGEMIGILPDQDPGRDNGIFAPFFGIPANTMTLLTRLATRAQATVFVTFAERLPDAQGFRLHFRRLNYSPSDSIETRVAALNKAVEEAIRLAPAQYLWTYKRFKTRPSGEKRVY